MRTPLLDSRDDSPVVLMTEDGDIPIPDAVQTCHAIRDKLDAALIPCECVEQGAPTKCGACDAI